MNRPPADYRRDGGDDQIDRQPDCPSFPIIQDPHDQPDADRSAHCAKDREKLISAHAFITGDCLISGKPFTEIRSFEESYRSEDRYAAQQKDFPDGRSMRSSEMR